MYVYPSYLIEKKLVAYDTLAKGTTAVAALARAERGGSGPNDGTVTRRMKQAGFVEYVPEIPAVAEVKDADGNIVVAGSPAVPEVPGTPYADVEALVRTVLEEEAAYVPPGPGPQPMPTVVCPPTAITHYAMTMRMTDTEQAREVILRAQPLDPAKPDPQVVGMRRFFNLFDRGEWIDIGQPLFRATLSQIAPFLLDSPDRVAAICDAPVLDSERPRAYWS